MGNLQVDLFILFQRIRGAEKGLFIFDKSAERRQLSTGTKSVPISGNEKCTTPQGEYWVRWLS
jgi:hypothetical protein